MKHVCLILATFAACIALMHGATNDYIWSQKPASGPLVSRNLAPTVGRIIGFPTSINSPETIIIGTGLTLTGSTLTASGGAWGSITGTLSAQGDLWTVLEAKANSSNLGALAFLGVVTSGEIQNGAITNSDINTEANIALSKLAATTASRLLVSDAAGFVSASTVTSTEAGYLSGVTSAIQTQLNAKIATSSLGTGIAAALAINTGTTGAPLLVGGTGSIANATADDTTYDATTWNASTAPPTKNAVRDKIESLGSGVGGSTGSTDNAILRADGAGGGTVQAGAATMTDAGAPTFYDSLTLLKTGSSDGTTMEVVNDPLNGGVRALYILPPGDSGRIYMGKPGRGVYSMDFSGVSSVTSFPSMIAVAPYSILTYVGNVSLQALNGNVVLETTAGGKVTIGGASGAMIEASEMTAPAAPAADKAYIYAEDNGSGKTRLMVRFPSGAAQQIAIEP